MTTVKANEHRRQPEKRPFWKFLSKSYRKSKVNGDPANVVNRANSQDISRKESTLQANTTPIAESTAEEQNDEQSKRTSPAKFVATERIPAEQSLTEAAVRRLFSGAPHFSAVSEEGQPSAFATFPWDLTLNTRDVNDSILIPHAAFSGASLSQHLHVQAPSTSSHTRSTITYDIEVTEKPSMLGATGSEPGTVGLAFFWQEPEADILKLYGEHDEADRLFEHFSNFELLESQPERLGIRAFDMNFVVERLADLSLIYAPVGKSGQGFSILNQTSTGELHAMLFSKILVTPKHDGAATDPTGLKIQIEALIRVLNLKRVWYDFSVVEWRIRVGQLLFTDGDVDLSGSTISGPEDGLSERDVVLLQLLLSCELYARLQAVAGLTTKQVKAELELTAEEVENFRQLETHKTKWDLVLAWRFLENVHAKTYSKTTFVPRSQNNFVRSLFGPAERTSIVQIDCLDVSFEPRQQNLRLDGLSYFAATLNWSNAAMLESRFLEIVDNAREKMQESAPPSIYATPLSTPGTMTPRSFRTNRESGYFGGVGSTSPEMTPRSFHLLPPSPQTFPGASNDQSRPSIGGWLTRTYLTGLVMPGEAISHLLMSTVLENDAEAMTALGENANLYSGFVYRDRSFWSKSCILGRVLACDDNSKECMGWVSSTILPAGFDDGWVDISSTPIPLSKLDESFLSAKSDILAGHEISATTFEDMSLPQDPTMHTGLMLRFEYLSLQPSDTFDESMVDQDAGYLPTLVFMSARSDTEHSLHDICLSHLVQFTSAFPCTPPHLSAVGEYRNDKGPDDRVELTPAHPLHMSYQYRQLHVTELLDSAFALNDSANGTVIVVDARGDCNLQLLARAWCSSQGVNALIARAWVTCISCAIREARGLNLTVLIRIGPHDRPLQ